MREYDYSVMLPTIVAGTLAHYADQGPHGTADAYCDLWGAFPTMADETHKAFNDLFMEQCGHPAPVKMP